MLIEWLGLLLREDDDEFDTVEWGEEELLPRIPPAAPGLPMTRALLLLLMLLVTLGLF